MTTAEMLRAEGEARGKAEDILVVFEQRGIDVDGVERPWGQGDQRAFEDAAFAGAVEADG